MGRPLQMVSPLEGLRGDGGKDDDDDDDDDADNDADDVTNDDYDDNDANFDRVVKRPVLTEVND